MAKIRHLVSILIPDIFLDYIGRHFTWLSETLFGFSISVNLILVILYVPRATANGVISATLSLGAGLATLVTLIGSGLTISDYIDKGETGDTTSITEGSEKEGQSSPVQGFVKTEEDLMKEAMEELEGLFEVHSDGEIGFTEKGENIKGDPKQCST